MSNQSIKILTVNMHKGFNAFNRRFVLHELRDAIRDVNADIVFLQEVLGEHRKWSKTYEAHWPELPQYEFLADSLMPFHAYGKNAIYADGHHGNALLSKFHIAQWRNLDISLNGIEKRGLLHCVLDTGESGPDIHTICVHLSLKETHRQQQLQALSRMVAEIPAETPLVIAGDFNDWRLKAQPVLRNLGMEDVCTICDGRPAKTFPAMRPILRLDRIYLRGFSNVQSLPMPVSPWNKLSDHRPLMAEIQF